VESCPYAVALYSVPVPGGDLVQVTTQAIEKLQSGETKTMSSKFDSL